MSNEITIKVKRELFCFNSKKQWINNAKSWFEDCGVRQGFYIAIDAKGRVMHMGLCFMEAEKQNTYPIKVYELETNWTQKLKEGAA